MGFFSSFELTPANAGTLVVGITFVALSIRIFYNLYLHPLSQYPGPWYTSSFSVIGALISYLRLEPQWLMYLVKRYGRKSNRKPELSIGVLMTISRP
jgi:hypothetical protein